jgi:2-C-methyl-D-erythritol 4-phosphate cytidylyltransferase / 2-C-methyl-D-erythritol 2,4-cyclodiphosphate synthase
VNADTRAGAVVPAAGRGERFGSDTPKALLSLHGRPLLQYPLEVLQDVDEVETIVVAAPSGAVDAVRRLAASAELSKVVAVVEGGADRQASVRRALEALPPGPGVVLVHDGVRPFLSASLVRDVVAAAVRDGGAVAAVPVDETIKSGHKGWVETTLDRSGLFRIQTPQAFRRTLLEEAHRAAEREGFRGTDDAALVERMGHRVRLVPGTATNLKVTLPEDLALAEALARRTEAPAASPRVGLGFDAHRFVSGRPLILGGVEIPAPRGLGGHSDADVVVHAVMDALLGAAGCGDIGQHFPPHDPAHAGANSLGLLARVRDLLAAAGWRAAHVDVMVLAETPRLASHIPAMRAAIGGVLGLGEGSVNVKATTLEGLGAIGRGEGIAAQAVATLEATPRGGRR